TVLSPSTTRSDLSMTRPTKEDVTKVREQVNTAFEQVRTPLLAALGAGNLATKAVVDAVHKARERAGEGREGVRKTIDEANEGLRKTIDEAKKAAEDLRPAAELTELREKLNADERSEERRVGKEVKERG